MSNTENQEQEHQEPRKMYGWYSAKQAQELERNDTRSLSIGFRSGCSIYQGIDGKEVIVTLVTPTPERKYISEFCDWDDYVFLGEVVRFLRFVEN